ncbi:ABC transporter substrate-binding protein [Ensifer sp. YR511]|uniref:ABC transporter substrate-binding protein n=1 Tax=Ensifer sp. YR511 TaxID=1855294 RepID=UPI00088A3E90|nr:ABC transporter substrate-binding protein [Ensifer sp. YR511]SDO17257.1 peptide/nickel transport system substrate-binding protein [Ensifer sp. YR511]
MKFKEMFLAVALLAGFVGGASADTLKVNLAAPVSSMDPHYQSASPNAAMARNIFDTLVIQDGEQQLNPGLATSWRTIDERTWEFKLREGVKFHDGTPFTAEDVAYTIRRIPTLDSPGSLERYIRPIVDIEIMDPLTIRLKTAQPFPLIPVYMSGFVIVSKQAVDGKPLSDFNSGAATIGTGPYKFKSWVPGDNVLLERNEDYWGEKPDFEAVSIKFVPEDAARVTQLLTGEADFIDQVPPQLVERVSSAAGVKLSKAPSYRFIYMGVSFRPEATTYVAGPKGERLEKSPLLDQRVRLALSKAIDRDAITARIMGGLAQPANQINLASAGASPNRPQRLYDPEGAKALLKEAGFPDGLSLTFIAPNDQYINDAQIAQAISQMMARIGVRVKLETLPASVMYDRMNKGEFGLFMFGHGATTGEPMGSLSNLVGTFNRELGQGSSNRGRYSNPDLDAMLAEAAVTMDDAKRSELLVKAIDTVMDDAGIIPLQHQFYVTALRDTLDFSSRVDERFLAANVHKSKK